MSLFGKTAKELVYELLVSKNPLLVEKNVTIDKLIFGTPSHVGGTDATPEEKYGRLNAQIKISGDTTKNVIGDITLSYRRIYVDYLFDGIALSVDGADATTAADLLPKLEAKYGIKILASEVKSQSISGTKATITLNGSSPVWIGSIDVFLTDMASDMIDLVSAAKIVELEGMEYNLEGMGPVTTA